MKTRIAVGVISFFLFQVSCFAQIDLFVLSNPSAGEIQTNHNAQTASPGIPGAGILIAGSVISASPLTTTTLRITFPAPITSSTTVPGADPIRIESASGVFATLQCSPCGDTSNLILSVTSSTIEITLPGADLNTISGSFRLVGVRIDANGKTGAQTLSASLDCNTCNYILSVPDATIITAINPGIGNFAIGSRSSQPNLGTATIFTNRTVPDPTGSLIIAEGFAAAFRTATQSSNSGSPVTNGSNIRLTFNDVPAGVTLTLGPNVAGFTASLSNTTITSAENTTTISFTGAGPSLTAVDTVEIEYAVAITGTAAVTTPGSITATATLVPIGDAVDPGTGLPTEVGGYPRFVQADEGPITVVNIVPPVGAAPTITSASPTSGTQGQTISNFTVNGGNFQPDTSTLSFSGTEITVNSYSFRTSTQIVASITIAGNATTGARNVIVTNSDSQQATLSSGFTILQFHTDVPPGTITTNTTWDLARSPFVVPCGGITVQGGATLTIEAGVVVKFQAGCSAYLTISGRFVADGTASQRIFFTSIRDDAVVGDTNGDGNATAPSSLDWSGLSFSSTSANSSLSNVVLRYARSGLSIYGSSPSITNSSFSDNGYSGSDAGITITSTGANPTITGNTITKSPTGIAVGDDARPTVQNNTITTTGSVAISAGPNSVAGITGNTASGSGLNGLLVQGTLTANATWSQVSMPYVMRTFSSQSILTVASGTTLTLSPGVVFKSYGSLNGAFVSIQVDGTLVANGTASQKIVFTSLADDTVGGDTNSDGNASGPSQYDWSGLSFNATSTNSSLSNVTLRYARSGLQITASSPSITNSIFSDAQFAGITITNNGTSPTITGTTVSRNPVGVSVSGGATPHISFNTIQGNSSFGVINADCPNNVPCSITPDVDATNNYWGNANGPSRDPDRPGFGDKVSFHVTFSPFLGQPASRGPSITAVSPSSGTQGQTITTFRVNGDNFQPLATLSFSGTGISVNSYSSRTATQIVASIAVASTATLGFRDVTVTNTDSQQATLKNGFMVLESPTVSFTITVNTDKPIYNRGQPVLISGSVLTQTSAPLANVPVIVELNSHGFVHTINVATNAGGLYQAVFQPNPTEAGNFGLKATASFGGVSQLASVSFRIQGLLIDPVSISFDQAMGTDRLAALSVKNLGDSTLSNLTISLIDNSPSDTITATLGTSSTTSLGAGESTSFGVNIHAPAGTLPASPVSFTIRATAADSASGVVAQETALITVTLHPATSTLVFLPSNLTLGVNPGKTVQQTLTVRNDGFIAASNAVVSLRDPSTFNWIALGNVNLGTVNPGESKPFQFAASPPATQALSNYAVVLDVTGGTSQIQATVNVNVNMAALGNVTLVISDDTGAKVKDATVTLFGKTNGKTFQSVTDSVGLGNLTGIDAGDYDFFVTALAHDPAEGTVTVLPGATQQVKVLLTFNIVNLSFNVTPTTIPDQYNVTVTVTYSTDLPKPALRVLPYFLDVSLFPRQKPQLEFLITDTHPTAPVRNITFDTSKLKSGLQFTFPFAPLEIAPLAGKKDAHIPFTVELSDPNLPTGDMGNLMVCGDYDFSLDGQVLTTKTCTPVPVRFIRPQDVTVCPVSFINDETDGNLNDLQFAGSSFICTVTNNRNEKLTPQSPAAAPFNGRNLVAFTATDGGSSALDVITGNSATAFWRIDFDPSRLDLNQGESTTFDISKPDGGKTLQQALEQQLAANRDRLLNHANYVGFEGKWNSRNLTEGFLNPIAITTIRPNQVITSSIGEGAPGGCSWCGTGTGTTVPPLPRVLPNNQGQIVIAIDQTIRLEREAFNAVLGIAPNAPLTNVRVQLQIRDSQGTDASSKFFLVTTDPAGATTGGNISNLSFVNWTIIPSADAGGTASQGQQYTVQATMTYSFNGLPFNASTQMVDITVLPSPKLTVTYSVPFVIMAGKDAKVRVVVKNDGYGTARNLTIESLQPRIVRNDNNLPIYFQITGSSNPQDSSSLTINFGNVASGATVTGFWTLRTNHDGFFIDVSSTFSQQDFQGVKLDPLVNPPTTVFVPAVGGTVTIVTNNGTQPVAGMDVILSQSGITRGSDRTDAAGVYYVPDLAGGAYLGEVKDSGGATLTSKPITVLRDQATNFVNFTIQPAISVSPSPIVFPATLLNTRSSPVTVAISNPGTATLVISTIAATSPFFISVDLLHNFNIPPIPSGGQVQFDMIFIPTGPGPFPATLTIESNAPTSPTTTPLQGSVLMPASSNVGPPSQTNQQGTSSEPVSTGNGNYYYQHTDVVIPGRGLPIVFQSTYNALDNYLGPLGANWTHSYNIVLTDASTAAVIKWGDGHGETFTLSGSNYVPQPGVFSTLTKNADGTFVLTRKDQTRYGFSSVGKLNAVQDKNGNTVLLSYDGQGNFNQITNAAGRSLTFNYDASNRIRQITDPLGRAVLFSYDGNNNLIQATDPAGGATTFVYDANHRVRTIVQPSGQLLLENTYDSAGRVLSQTNGRGFTTTFAYGTPTPGDTRITDARGNQTIHTYDASLRITKITDAAGGTTSFTYDANNNRTGVTNQNSRTTTFSYDSRANITGITDPLGNVVLLTYDSANNLLMAKNAKGNTTTFTYDPNGNLVLIRDVLGNATVLGYDSFGELIAKTDARGSVTTYSYDGSGDLRRITDAGGNATALNYDGIGRLVSVTDANSHTATATYDALSRLTRVADPLGNQTQFVYDGVGNLVNIIDANGNATLYAYDAANNLASVTDALWNITRYAYDENNNRVAFTNTKENITSYAYDALDRLTRVTDPLSFVNSYVYDSAGNAVAITDANGRTNQFVYDALSRLTNVWYADGKMVTFSYDVNGNRTSMVDSTGTTKYTYDTLERLVAVTDPNGKVVRYAYDAVGNRGSLTNPDGKVISYTYDAANRLSQAKDWLGRNTSYTYDSVGNLTKTLYPNATSTTFSHDAANRLTRVVNSALGLPLLNLVYTLDPVGNRKSLNVDGVVTTFGYDALNQLASAQLGPLKTTWTYDPAGNRLKETSPFRTTNYSYDVADRLLAAGTTTFIYDANGNQISKRTSLGTLAYSYDAAKRLIRAVGLGVNSSFAYDGDGNRVMQTTAAGSYSYVHDVATALPVVVNEQGPDGNITYAYGLGLIEAFSSSFNFFYHYDGLGSTIALTDAAGKPQAAYAYDPWGNPLITIPDSVGTKNKFRFTGEALDPGTGLYYLRARYYDPSAGRFISKDPFPGIATQPLSLHKFIYTVNNPTNFTDPLGLIRDAATVTRTRTARTSATSLIASPQGACAVCAVGELGLELWLDLKKAGSGALLKIVGVVEKLNFLVQANNELTTKEGLIKLLDRKYSRSDSPTKIVFQYSIQEAGFDNTPWDQLNTQQKWSVINVDDQLLLQSLWGGGPSGRVLLRGVPPP